MTNPIALDDSGNAMVYDGKAWAPAPVAVNEQGQKLIHNGESWAPLPSAAKPDTGRAVSRIVGQGAQGFNDAIADTIGAPVDAAAWAMRKIGIPATNPIGGSESIKSGLDYVAKQGRNVVNALAQGSAAPLSNDASSRFEPETMGEKIASGVGQGIGSAASVILPAAAIARGARAGSITESAANTLASQPVAQTTAAAAGGAVGSATDNPYAGVAASLAVPVGIVAGRRAITPVRNVLSAQEGRLVQAADNEGIPLTAAQRTGSPALKQVEGTMAKIPGASGPMQETIDNQRGQFNRAVLERAGVTATDASPETLNRAFRNAGQTFDDLAARTTLNVDRQFAQDVGNVINDYGRRLPTDVAPVFRSYIEDLAPAIQAAAQGQSPQIAGDAYAAIRSGISRRIRAAHGRPDLQEALGGLQEALDGAVERSTSGRLRQEWQDARREYQALMTVDKSMQGGSQADRAAGNIPLGALKNSVQQGDRAGFSRGRGQLNELARVGDFIGTRVPDSGTGTRNAVANPLMWPVMLGGNVASRIYNSGPAQAYLSNNLAGPANVRALYGGIAAREGLNEAHGVNALQSSPSSRASSGQLAQQNDAGDSDNLGTMARAFRKAVEKRNAFGGGISPTMMSE